MPCGSVKLNWKVLGEFVDENFKKAKYSGYGMTTLQHLYSQLEGVG